MIAPAAFVLPVAGLAVGSFIGLVSLRLPAGAPVLIGRSACPGCGRALRPRELVPVLSYLIQRGRCRRCAAPIAWRYPLIELGAAAIGAVAIVIMPWPAAIAAALLGWGLLLLALLDAEHFWLPRAVTVPLALAGLLASLVDGGASSIDRLIGAAAGFFVLAGLARGYASLRGREGLGGGDAILFGAGGAWTGWQGLPWVMLVAAWGGLAWVALTAIKRRWSADSRLPFGCFLAPAIWLVYLLRR